jgi:hypothetical protein
VAKRLDCFLVFEPFLEESIKIRQCVSSGGYFDHSLVFLELAPTENKHLNPFK